MLGEGEAKRQGQGHLEPLHWGNWQSEGWGTLFLRGPGHQSCFRALGPGVPGALLCEAWRAPARRASRVCLCARNGSFLLPRLPASSLRGQRSQGKDLPCDETSFAQVQLHAKTAQLCHRESF